VYALLLCVNDDHDLTHVHVSAVDPLYDTGPYSMEVILDTIATGTDFIVDELVPIYKAFAKVGAGHSAQLRGAIGKRLMKEGKFGQVSEVALVAPESLEMELEMEPDSENEHDVVDID